MRRAFGRSGRARFIPAPPMPTKCSLRPDQSASATLRPARARRAGSGARSSSGTRRTPATRRSSASTARPAPPGSRHARRRRSDHRGPGRSRRVGGEVLVPGGMVGSAALRGDDEVASPCFAVDQSRVTASSPERAALGGQDQALRALPVVPLGSPSVAMYRSTCSLPNSGMRLPSIVVRMPA